MDRLQRREVGNPVPGFPVESCLVDELRTALFNGEPHTWTAFSAVR